MNLDLVLASRASRLAFGISESLGGARLSILIFHRVLALPDPLLPGEVDAKQFDRLMRLVARAFNVLTLGEAIAHLVRGCLPPRSLVITFDDGYADNARVALPILRQHGLKATLFVSTGFLNGGRMWNDTVIEALRNATVSHADLGEFGLESQSLATLADRRAAMNALLPRIKYRPLAERETALRTLIARLKPSSLPDDLMMSSDQVRQLRGAGMEIGAHTVNHPILTSLPAAQAWNEIVQGREQLAATIDHPVDVMAYPNGVPGRDFDATHVEMLKRMGFRGAVTTAPGVARVGDDPFQLPRFSPWDRPLWRWAARLLLNQRRIHFDSVRAGEASGLAPGD
ncbi:MAG: polysaccharide deacetylase family protein [Rubrivivax sp.]|nr:polysaccharide deacetylase family protein [Rubrivivax sp.]